MVFIHDLLSGNWPPENFLVVPPGHRIRASNDDAIIRAEATQPPCLMATTRLERQLTYDTARARRGP